MYVVTIRTPTHLRPTLDTDGSTVVMALDLAPHIEREIRPRVAAIFDERPYISGNDPPDLISTYLESIAEPMAWLSDVGVQITAIIREGTADAFSVANYP